MPEGLTLYGCFIPLWKPYTTCWFGVGLQKHLGRVTSNLGEVGWRVAHSKGMGQERMTLGVETAMLDPTAFQAPLPMLTDLIVVDAPVGSWREEDQPIALVQPHFCHLFSVG